MPQNSFLQSPTAIPPRTSSSSAQQHGGNIATVRNSTTPSEQHWLGQVGYNQTTAGTSGSKNNSNNNNNNNSSSSSNSNSPNQIHQHRHIRMMSSATSSGTRRLSNAARPPSAPAPMTATFLSSPQPASTPPDPNRYAFENLDFTSSRRTWSEDKNRIVRGPFDYLNAQPGKDFRTQLIAAFNVWLEVPDDSVVAITQIVGMLHTASLLVDDVEDSASLRRGLPVAHSIFGVAQTINSANYIYFCTLQELQKLHNHQEALAIYSEELVNLHRGQGMDLFWRDTLTCPTEEDYLEMVGNKTGGLFRLGIKLMQAESRTGVDCIPLANLIGLIFQIRDDYQNLSSQEYSDNKGLCEDLTEGKFSFPIIHSIRSDPTNLQLVNILGQKTTDAEVKRYAVAYMQGTGSFEYTRRVVGVLVQRARNLAEEMDRGQGRSSGVNKILDLLSI